MTLDTMMWLRSHLYNFGYYDNDLYNYRYYYNKISHNDINVGYTSVPNTA